MKSLTFKQGSPYLLIVPFLFFFFFTSNKSCAQVWQAAEELVHVPGEMCYDPCIAVFNNYVYVAWEDYRDGVSPQAYLRSSDNYGEGFQPGIRLSVADDIEVSEMNIACWEDRVHVVWMGEDAASDNQVYYCQSNDGGQTFSLPVQITSASSESFTPDIAVFENNIHIVWVDLKDMPSAIRVYYMRSTDGGSTWSPEIPLGEMGKEGYMPRIAADGHKLFLSWINLNVPPAGSEIYFIRSTDNGENWGPISPIYYTSTTITVPRYSLGTAGGKVNIIWEDFRNGSTFQVYHGRSPDDGNTFEPESCLNTGTAEYRDPEMASVAEFLHSCWSNESNQIEYRRSVNQGDDWESTVVISEPAINSYSPDIEAFNDNAYAVWEQANTSGTLSIYFRRTTSDYSIDEISVGDKSRPILYQNYPNPCIGSTCIHFYMPEKSEASISIYNTSGKLVEKIGPHRYPEGEHKIMWNTSSCDPGVYYYRLVEPGMQDATQLKKLIIMEK